MDAAGIPYDAAQPPIVMVVMMMEIYPFGVVGRRVCSAKRACR